MLAPKPLLFAACLTLLHLTACSQGPPARDFVSAEINPKTASVEFFLWDAKGEPYGSLGELKDALGRDGYTLRFAMNGGMFDARQRPVGLYIEKGQQLSPVDTVQEAYGNFYLQPNGIFYLTQDKKAYVVPTTEFVPRPDIHYATQSGPMLLIDGEYHPAFRKESESLNIRNGVGILPNGNVLFAISKVPVNFYTFASFFKHHGCENALYLDGSISKAYAPAQDWEQLDGTLGVLIGVVDPK